VKKELATKRKTQRNSKKIKTEFKELLAVGFWNCARGPEILIMKKEMQISTFHHLMMNVSKRNHLIQCHKAKNDRNSNFERMKIKVNWITIYMTYFSPTILNIDIFKRVFSSNQLILNIFSNNLINEILFTKTI
jgi:hypothetical protein